jgi:ABC-type glutathione transport system ATPase component
MREKLLNVKNLRASFRVHAKRFRRSGRGFDIATGEIVGLVGRAAAENPSR